MRLMVGAFEAGFYPTAVAYLSCFYPRYDLAVRLALFFGQYAIAGAFSSSLGGLLMNLPTVSKLMNLGKRLGFSISRILCCTIGNGYSL
jgi:MFS family permease